MKSQESYLMESEEEAFRLDIKTDPEAVRKQARWCELKPGLRVLDAGCGPGKVTSILHDVIQPGGSILGVDYSKQRILHAEEHYGRASDMDFRIHDLQLPLKDAGLFDLIWVRFVLEYNRAESYTIVRNLTNALKPGGLLCLLDLDHNCLSHYELGAETEKVLKQVMKEVELKYNFDPYAGRKLYSYLYDLSFENIQLDLIPHHLIYGEIGDQDLFNWVKKVEMGFRKADHLFAEYPGGHDGFFADFLRFFKHPRRFTYTPMILCKGRKPLTPPKNV